MFYYRVYIDSKPDVAPLQDDKQSIINKAKTHQSCYKTIQTEILAMEKDNSWYGLYVSVRLSTENTVQRDDVLFSAENKRS